VIESQQLKYCIDYRNGGMGSAVLSHILYACNKVDIDLDIFFSDVGDAHNIRQFKDTELVARHLIEFPDDQKKCIIQLNSDGWNQVLQLKMSYAKHYKAVPALDNVLTFFSLTEMPDQSEKLWKEFYNNFKDPSWPECARYSDVGHLPIYMQDEIYENYQFPDVFDITDNDRLLEFLTLCYFDRFNTTPPLFPLALSYPLSKYLDNQVDDLKHKICQVLGWKWNQTKSDSFYHAMITHNSKYLLWLDSIKSIFDQTIAFCEYSADIDIWERAVILAKVCQHFDIEPKQLHWHLTGCFLDKNNVSLVNNLKEIKYGKTI
jgi:hypothetical protein